MQWNYTTFCCGFLLFLCLTCLHCWVIGKSMTIRTYWIYVAISTDWWWIWSLCILSHSSGGVYQLLLQSKLLITVTQLRCWWRGCRPGRLRSFNAVKIGGCDIPDIDVSHKFWRLPETNSQKPLKIKGWKFQWSSISLWNGLFWGAMLFLQAV